MQAAVAVEGLLKRYGTRTVVDGLSFAVPAGRVLALLGPNGAGKTTTVECIAGLRRPDGGSVRVLGHNPAHDRERAVAGLGLMLQEGGVHRAATARELLRLFAALHPDPLDPDTLLARLDIERLADQRVRTLSIGERQRVSLALALVGRPRVAILDEPTAGMDPTARRRVWDVVEELRTDGVAILLTTHAMEEAERLADDVAVVDGGRLLALDRTEVLTGGTGTGLVLTIAAPFDTAQLAADLAAEVRGHGPGRWLVDVEPERMGEVASWFTERQLPLDGISTVTRSLEDVYLRLTDHSGKR